jgi:hypothetical protein
MVQDPVLFCPQFRSYTSHMFTQTFQNFHKKCGINSLTLWSIFMMDHSSNIIKTMSMILIFERLLLAFLLRGEPPCFHSSLNLFVSGSYLYIYDSSPVITLCKKLEPSSFSIQSWQQATCHRSCS